MGLRAAAFAALLLCWTAAARADDIVLVTDPWCPFACEEKGDRPGVLIEVARSVFEPLGHRVEYRVMPFKRAEFEVETGKAQGFVGVLKIARRAAYSYPAQEQGSARVCFYTRPEAGWRYSGPASLARQRTGTIEGYAYNSETDAALQLARAEPVPGAQALAHNIEKLQRGRLDVVVEFAPVMDYALRDHPGALRNAGCADERIPLYIAFSPADPRSPELARRLSEGMTALRRSGRLAEILARYGMSDWRP